MGSTTMTCGLNPLLARGCPIRRQNDARILEKGLDISTAWRQEQQVHLAKFLGAGGLVDIKEGTMYSRIGRHNLYEIYVD